MRIAKLFVSLALLLCGVTPAPAQTIDEVYKKALSEGGTLNFYATLAQVNAATILPAFEKRFPGVKVNHVDATSDQLAARIIAESRGGKVIADVFQTLLDGMIRVQSQGLFLDKLYAEAAAYPAELKGANWVATDLIYIVPAWNTTQVKKEEEPKQFEDFAEPRWKGRLIAEPRDAEFLIAFAEQKYKNSDKAVGLFKRIAANGVEFHSGHPQLAELLTAGQGAICLTCCTHHLLPRMHKGAPLNYMRSFGVGLITATAVFKNAPHPNTAWLFHRWAASDEGQKAFGIEGRVPANPKVEPAEAIGLETVYGLGEKEYKEFAKYEKIWKQIFGIR